MAITVISMADGGGVEYLPGSADVDYIADGENVDQLNTNRAMKNLAFRDSVFRDKTNEIIAILNNAAGTTADVAARIDAEHDPDGTHPGGAPHSAATIPGGHNYLSITPLQSLTANVDNPLVPTGGSGLLVAADDIRMVQEGFVTVGVGGVFANVTTAYAAGMRKMLLISNVTEPGAVSMDEKVEIHGSLYSVASPSHVWKIPAAWPSMTLGANAGGSIIKDLVIGDGSADSFLWVRGHFCTLRNLRINTDGSATTYKINVSGDYTTVGNIVEAPGTACRTLLGIQTDYNEVRNVYGSSLSSLGTGYYHVWLGGSWNIIENIVATANVPVFFNSLTDSIVRNVEVSPAAIGYDGTKYYRAERCVFENFRINDALSSAVAAAHGMNFTNYNNDLTIRNVRHVNSVPPSALQECGVISLGDYDHSSIRIQDVYGQRVHFGVSLIESTTIAQRTLQDIVINNLTIADSDEATLGTSTYGVRCSTTPSNAPLLYDSIITNVRAGNYGSPFQVGRGVRIEADVISTVIITNCTLHTENEPISVAISGATSGSRGLYISSSYLSSFSGSGIHISVANNPLIATQISDVYAQAGGGSGLPDINFSCGSGGSFADIKVCSSSSIGGTSGGAFVNLNVGSAPGTSMSCVTVNGCNRYDDVGGSGQFVTFNLQATSNISEVSITGCNFISGTGKFLNVTAAAIDRLSRIAITGNNIKSGAANVIATNAADTITTANVTGNIYSSAALTDGAVTWNVANNLNA